MGSTTIPSLPEPRKVAPPVFRSQHRLIRDLDRDNAARRRADVRRIASTRQRWPEERDSELVRADLATTFEPDPWQIGMDLERRRFGSSVRRRGGSRIPLSQILDRLLARPECARGKGDARP